MTARELLFQLSGHREEPSAARVLAERLRYVTKSDLQKPLCLPGLKAIAEYQGIVEIRFGAPLVTEGILVPLDSGGFCVRVFQKSHLTRARFTLAHEIGHTFFFDRSAIPPKRILPYSRSDVAVATSGSSTEVEERFCDEFAGELLLPQCAASVVVKNHRLDSDPVGFLQEIESISREWAISVRTVLSRLNQIGVFPTSMMVLVLRECRHVKTRENPALRVCHVFPTVSDQWFVPSNQRADTVGLHGAVFLSKHWKTLLSDIAGDSANTSGVLSAICENGTFQAVINQDVQGRCVEKLWVRRKKTATSRWKRVKLSAPVSYRMYATNRDEWYCLAVIDLSKAETIYG